MNKLTWIKKLNIRYDERAKSLILNEERVTVLFLFKLVSLFIVSELLETVINCKEDLLLYIPLA